MNHNLITNSGNVPSNKTTETIINCIRNCRDKKDLIVIYDKIKSNNLCMEVFLKLGKDNLRAAKLNLLWKLF